MERYLLTGNCFLWAAFVSNLQRAQRLPITTRTSSKLPSCRLQITYEAASLSPRIFRWSNRPRKEGEIQYSTWRPTEGSKNSAVLPLWCRPSYLGCCARAKFSKNFYPPSLWKMKCKENKLQGLKNDVTQCKSINN